MVMTKLVGINPGLFPVVQVTEVVEAALTGQTIPSMTMLYVDYVALKPVPVKTTSVPPTTVPHLGLILVNAGVMEP
jgi:hypothetical protein